MDGGAGEGERMLLRLAVRQVGMTGGRELVQMEGVGEPWGRCWKRGGPEPRWMKWAKDPSFPNCSGSSSRVERVRSRKSENPRWR